MQWLWARKPLALTLALLGTAAGINLKQGPPAGLGAIRLPRTAFVEVLRVLRRDRRRHRHGRRGREAPTCEELCEEHSIDESFQRNCLADCRVKTDLTHEKKKARTLRRFAKKHGRAMREAYEDVSGEEFPECEPERKPKALTVKLKEADKDGDGKISPEEAVDFAKALCISGPTENDIFGRNDVDGDGALSEEEWTRAGEETIIEYEIERFADKSEDQSLNFDALNTNGDDTLEESELLDAFMKQVLKQYPKMTPEERDVAADSFAEDVAGIMLAADDDGDGFLSRKEFEALSDGAPGDEEPKKEETASSGETEEKDKGEKAETDDEKKADDEKKEEEDEKKEEEEDDKETEEKDNTGQEKGKDEKNGQDEQAEPEKGNDEEEGEKDPAEKDEKKENEEEKTEDKKEEGKQEEEGKVTDEGKEDEEKGEESTQKEGEKEEGEEKEGQKAEEKDKDKDEKDEDEGKTDEEPKQEEGKEETKAEPEEEKAEEDPKEKEGEKQNGDDENLEDEEEAPKAEKEEGEKVSEEEDKSAEGDESSDEEQKEDEAAPAFLLDRKTHKGAVRARAKDHAKHLSKALKRNWKKRALEALQAAAQWHMHGSHGKRSSDFLSPRARRSHRV